MPTLRHLLQNHPWEGSVAAQTNSSVSTKAKAEPLPNLLKYVHTIINADTMFPEREDDSSRLSVVFSDIPLLRQTIHTEGDVRRVFAELAKHVEYAFSGMSTILLPRLVQRWEAGPPGPNVTTTDTIDLWFGLRMGPGADAGHLRSAAIGELKRPGILIKEDWVATSGTNGKRLGREMRMYARQYKCPQTFYFDGQAFVVLRFRARNVQDILLQTCPVDTCYIKDIKQVPYWVYKLCSEGLNRIQGANAPDLLLDGYERYFQYFDGAPYWRSVQGGDSILDHPGGYKRTYDKSTGVWWWALGGNKVAQDTYTCFN